MHPTYGLSSVRIPILLNPSRNFGHRRRSFFPKVQVSKSVGAGPENQLDSEEQPLVDLAFVHSVLLPDGTPDLHFRRAEGGQNLRDIMLYNNIELYGPNARPLLNCAGGGTCATCMVEVIAGDQLLSPRTKSEKEKLKKKPKNWRLACQTTVGNSDSTGMVLIQQLPEWKAHEWQYTDLEMPSS